MPQYNKQRVNFNYSNHSDNIARVGTFFLTVFLFNRYEISGINSDLVKLYVSHCKIASCRSFLSSLKRRIDSMYLKIVFIRRFSVRSIPRKLLLGYREEIDYDTSQPRCFVRSRTRHDHFGPGIKIVRKDAPSD